jgi:hypothetical protein
MLGDGSNLATIRLRKDNKKILYYRYIENIFELLEKIGGFKESIYPLIFLLAWYW